MTQQNQGSEGWMVLTLGSWIHVVSVLFEVNEDNCGLLVIILRETPTKLGARTDYSQGAQPPERDCFGGI